MGKRSFHAVLKGLKGVVLFHAALTVVLVAVYEKTSQELRLVNIQKLSAPATRYPQLPTYHDYNKKARKRRMWRYDESAPRIKQGWVLRVDAVPAQHRLPEKIPNLTSFLLQPQNQYPLREYLFDYNPSIVRLPASQIPTEFAGKARYLASFRVANRNYCLHPSDRKAMFNDSTPVSRDYLGLALLTHNLTSVADVVISQDSLVGMLIAEDFRLFVLGGQLYLSSNDLLTPIWLQRPPNNDSVTRVPALFGGNLSVSMRNFASCAPCGRARGVCGKNINYFEGPHGTIMAKIWPSSPHLVREVSIENRCRRTSDPASSFRDESRPVATFDTVEQVYFPKAQHNLLTRGRGGACCVKIANPLTNQTLFMGIQHSKTLSQGRRHPNTTANHYLSSFYAFDVHAPYRLVALSGYFCLEFPTELEGLPYSIVHETRWRNLQIGDTFDCPRISFVSGMTLDANDPTSVLIAYGVNDCFSRFVRISLGQICSMLFDD